MAGLNRSEAIQVWEQRRDGENLEGGEDPDSDLTLAICYWLWRLDLENWDVRAQFVPWSYFRPTGTSQTEVCNGLNTFNRSLGVSFISILQSAHYDHASPWTQDQEKTLVHELLHLWCASNPTEDGTEEDYAQERMIEQLAINFVTMRRMIADGYHTVKGLEARLDDINDRERGLA